MALPIAHATVGYVLHKLDRRRTEFNGWGRALVFMAIANLPDTDFLIGFVLGRPGAFHRGFSHTVLAAALFGALAGALCHWRFRDRWMPASAMFTLVYASHLFVDALTIDQRGPAGAQFFWPLSDHYFTFPFTIFTEILIDGESRAGFLRSVIAWPTAIVLAREILIASFLLALAHVARPWLRIGDDEGLGLQQDREEDLA